MKRSKCSEEQVAYALRQAETLASWLRDGRQPGKFVHGVRELLRQRVLYRQHV